MKKTIYVSHSRNFDFKNELYKLLRESRLNKDYRIILPHESGEFNSKYLLRNNCELMIAEVSMPSTGLGIEIGWADLFEVPVIMVSKRESKNSSLSKIVALRIEYDDGHDLIQKLEEVFKKRHF